MRICTLFGIAGADASEGNLGWLDKGKYTLPNSSGRLKTTECPENSSRIQEEFSVLAPKASPAIHGRPCAVCTDLGLKPVQQTLSYLPCPGFLLAGTFLHVIH